MYMFVRHLWHMSTASRLPLVPHARLAARSPYGTCRLRSSAAWASCVGLSRLPWLACCRSVVSCGPQSTLLRIRCLGSRVRVSYACLHTSVLVGSDARILCASPSRMAWIIARNRKWLGGLLALRPSISLRGGSDVRRHCPYGGVCPFAVPY